MKKRYRFLNHPADIGIKVYGDSMAELFENGAFALYDLLLEVTKVSPKREYPLSVRGEDLIDLWVNFLRETLSMFQVGRIACRECRVLNIQEGKVEALFYGEELDLNRHQLKQEIKAVTYHQAWVKKLSSRWEGRVIFDV